MTLTYFSRSLADSENYGFQTLTSLTVQLQSPNFVERFLQLSEPIFKVPRVMTLIFAHYIGDLDLLFKVTWRKFRKFAVTGPYLCT